MVQAVRSRSATKVRFAVGIAAVVLMSVCVAAGVSWSTSMQPRPTELDMESNDANFLLKALPTMKYIPPAPTVSAAPKVKKVEKTEPSSEASIMQHDIDSLKKNLKAHLEKETSDHIQLNTLHTDKVKAVQVEHSLEAKIASEKLQLHALESHTPTELALAPARAPVVAAKSVPSQIVKAAVVSTAASDKKAQAAMLKALRNAQVPSPMKSKISNGISKVQSVLAKDEKQKQILAGVEMKISNVEASEARDKASLSQVTRLEARLKGAAQILRSRVAKEASMLKGYVAKQDQLAPIVQRDEARDQKLKSLVSAISKKAALSSKAQRTQLLQRGPVILTELAQFVAEFSHNSQPTDLTFSMLAAENADTIKQEISANEASLAKVQKYLKTVDSEERAFRDDIKLVQRQEIPIRAGLKAMADI